MPPVVDWGRREYGDALDAMRALVARRRAGAIGDTLVLVEHPAVVTVGVQGDDGGAAASGLPVFHVERGGHATYHGPGQLVGYPIVDLDPRGRDIRRFVHDLEALLVATTAAFGVPSGHVEGQRGVWVDGVRKIASIGIAVDHWVSFHGFALNVDPDLADFARIRPCGFDASVMTSLARERGRPIGIADVTPVVRAQWAERFEPVAVPARTPPPAGPTPA
ncbi:MAG TPA: lipoyl(octanoyl) transferase LipB [Thermoplasmata archaeon]|nr:lipoyl(octanoyl) transferase LipB [Thermoplasmata archaeon]